MPGVGRWWPVAGGGVQDCRTACGAREVARAVERECAQEEEKKGGEEKRREEKKRKKRWDGRRRRRKKKRKGRERGRLQQRR